MKILVRNQDGIEEQIDAQVIRLEPDDVIVVKLDKPNIPQDKIQKYVDEFRNIFKNNKIVFVRDETDITIFRQGGNTGETI